MNANSPFQKFTSMKLVKYAALMGLMCLTHVVRSQIVPDYALRDLDTTVAKFPLPHLLNGSYNVEMIHDSIRTLVAGGKLDVAIQTLAGWKERMEAAGDTSSFDYAVVQLDLGWGMMQLGDYITSKDLIGPLISYRGGKSAVSHWAIQRLSEINTFAGQATSALNQGAYLYLGDSILKEQADVFDIEGMNLSLSEDSIYYTESIDMFRQYQSFLRAIRKPKNARVVDDFVEFLDEMIRLGEFNDAYERTGTINTKAATLWIGKVDRSNYSGAARNSAYIYGAEYFIRTGQVQLGFMMLDKMWKRMQWELDQPMQTHFEAFPYLIVNGVLMEAHAWNSLNQPRKVIESVDTYEKKVLDAKQAIFAKTGVFPPRWNENPELLMLHQLKMRACLHPDVSDVAGAISSCESFFKILSRIYQREESDEGKIWLIRTAYSTMQQVVKVAVFAMNSPQSDIDIKRRCLRNLLRLDSYKSRLIATKWLGTIRSADPQSRAGLDQKLAAIREEEARWRTIQVTNPSRGFESKIALAQLEDQEFEILQKMAGWQNAEFDSEEIEDLSEREIYDALEPDEAVLYFFEGFSSIHRIVVQKNAIRIDELPKPGWVNNRPVQASAYSNGIKEIGQPFQATDEYRVRALALRKLLWPWESANDAPKKVSIFPDGHLWNLSFDALIYEADSKANFQEMDYLLRHHEISYWPGLRIWLGNRSEDVRYSKGGMLSISPAFLKSAQFANDTSANAIPMEALPKLLEASKQLEGLYDGQFLGEEQGTEGIAKELMENKSVLSLASHAFANEQEPLASYIALYPSSDPAKQDGRLHAYEILSMQLKTELVMLWGCSTGSGRRVRGEGLLSLARAFLASGARSVLMSQWDMGEAATAMMMPLYFKHLANGLGKAEALRQAKLEFLETAGPLEADPHQWAGWALIGDDHHLHTELRRANLRPWTWALVASCGLSLFFAVSLLRKRSKRTN